MKLDNFDLVIFFTLNGSRDSENWVEPLRRRIEKNIKIVNCQEINESTIENSNNALIVDFIGHKKTVTYLKSLETKFNYLIIK